MIERAVTPVVRELFARHPIVTITGPRQSGKTTLCRTAFPDLSYVNLERPDTRERALGDPRGFLRQLGTGSIIDEIQRVPELASYLQVIVDETDEPGQFILTGSQQLRISETVSQSLAGRSAMVRLLPFSIAEARQLRPQLTVEEMLFTGFYPRIYDHGLDPAQALGDYFETYVERDVRLLSEIRNLTSFQRFVRLCAGRAGQLLNLHGLGNDAGVSHTTARHWLSLLEASYVVFRLPPYFANVSKRLVKSPKLYFYDVGLAAHLLGIEHARQVLTHPLRGALFENLVVIEALKHRFSTGRRSNLHFYRDSSQLEVDLLYPIAENLIAIEAKAGETVSGQFFAGFEKLRGVLGSRVLGEILVHGSEERYLHAGSHVTGPSGFVRVLAGLEAELSG